MTGLLLVAAVPAVVALAVFATFLVRALRSEHVERDWRPGQAVVVATTPWRGSRADAPHGAYQVRARLRTADGRELEAWAEGVYDKADRWVGSTRPAWHHPTDVARYRLTSPEGVGGGLLQLMSALVLVAVVVVVFVGVAVLAAR